MHFHAGFFGFAAVIDAAKDGDAFGLENGLQALEGLFN